LGKAAVFIGVLLLVIGLGVAASPLGKRLFRSIKNPLQFAKSTTPEGPSFQQAPGLPSPSTQGPAVAGTTRGSARAGGPSVVGKTPQDPGFPKSPLLAPGQIGPNGQPLTSAQGIRGARPGQPVTGFPQNLLPKAGNPLQNPQTQGNPANPTLNPKQPQPQAINPLKTPEALAELDNYLAWLRRVELGGQALGDQVSGEMAGLSLSQLDGLLNNDEDLGQQRLLNNANRLVTRVTTLTNNYLAEIQRTVPPVPADCRQLHKAFMALTAAEVGGQRDTVILYADGMRRGLGGDRRGALAIVGKLKARLRILQNQHENAINSLNDELDRITANRGVRRKFRFKSADTPKLGSLLLGGL